MPTFLPAPFARNLNLTTRMPLLYVERV